MDAEEEDCYIIIIGDEDEESDSDNDSQIIIYDMCDDDDQNQLNPEALQKVSNLLNSVGSNSDICLSDLIKKEEIKDEPLEYQNEDMQMDFGDGSDSDYVCDVKEELDSDWSGDSGYKETLTEKQSKSQRTDYDSLNDAEKCVVETYRKTLLKLLDIRYGFERLSEVPYHEDTGLFSCSRCNFVDVDRGKVMVHYRRNHQPRNKMCLACCSLYHRSDYLLKHESKCKAENADLLRIARKIVNKIKRHPTVKEKKAMKVPCDLCGKYVTNQNLKVHRMIHFENTKFQCSECPASFRSTRSLQSHINAHRGVRPYQCDECPKAYTSAMVLRAHKLDHLKETYKCKECNRGFSRKYCLEQHMKVHTGERRFLCNECGKSFTHSTALEAHTRKHMGLPPAHPCTSCDKSFDRLEHLNMHMRKAHGVNIITRKMFFNKFPQMNSLEPDMLDNSN